MWAIKFIFLPITALIALNMGLNYSGFCKAEMRWLKDEEFIQIAMRESFDSYGSFPTRRMKVEFEKGRYQHQIVRDVIQYENFHDFQERNPDCCEVTDGKGFVPLSA